MNVVSIVPMMSTAIGRKRTDKAPLWKGGMMRVEEHVRRGALGLGWAAGVLWSGLCFSGALNAAEKRVPLSPAQHSASPPVAVSQTAVSQTAGNKRADLSRRVQILHRGDSSRTARRAAEQLLTQLRLTPAQQQQVQSVLRQTAYFRALPLMQFETDPRTYLYLTHQPDVTVGLWRAMGISKFHLKQIGPDRYQADTGDGTKGTIDVLHRSAHQQVILCQGILKSPLLLQSIQTRSVIHLQTSFSRQKDGRVLATHRAFVHVSFPSTTVRTVVRLLSPMGNLILDKNFREMSLFVHVMSLAMKRRPGWIEQISRRLEGLGDRKKNDLLKVTARVYYAARKRQTIPLFKTRQEYVNEIVRPLTTVRTVEKETSSPGATGPVSPPR